MNKFLIIIFIVGILITSCKKDDEPASVTPVWYSHVDSIITQTMVSSGSPGAIVGIFQYNNEPIVYAKGYSNISTLTEMDQNLNFRIASNTKTFTAQTVMLIAEDGLIDLDKHLNFYLPDCGIQYADTITVRQMLNMTSGIANYNAQAQFVDIWNSDPLIPWEKDTILSIINSASPDFYPGSSWNYSDSNYFLLGLLIETVTDNTVESEITNRILIPLEFNNTSFPITPDMPEDYCFGYKLNSSNILVECSRISPTGPWTGGAMISNIYDFGNWAKVLGTGSVLSESMKEQCFDWITISENTYYGLGLIQLAGLRGHTGMIQGYETIMLYSPEKDATIVVMLNKCNEDQHSQPAASLCINLFQVIYPDLF